MRNKSFSLVWILGLFVALAAIACSSTADQSEDQSIVVALRGTSTGVSESLTDLPDSLDALCFSDLQMVEVKSGRVIGTARDCLSNINPVGDGMALTGTTFFNFEEGGSLISRGQTTVQPTTVGSPNFTHITGAIPTAESNQVIAGTEQYQNASGTVRLSGAVNLSLLESDGQITFDCLFEITLKG